MQLRGKGPAVGGLNTEHELVIEAAVLSRNREKKLQQRPLQRAYRGVVCAGGCGTPYGKRRHDHNFVGSSEITGE